MGYAQDQNIGKPSNIKVFGNKYTKGHKHDRQNLLSSTMPD